MGSRSGRALSPGRDRPRALSKLDLPPLDMNKFVDWCEKRRAAENPHFYMQVVKFEEAVEALAASSKRSSKTGNPQALGASIISDYVAVGSPFEVTLPQDVREALIATKEFHADSFKAAKRICVEAMMTDLLPAFEAELEKKN